MKSINNKKAIKLNNQVQRNPIIKIDIYFYFIYVIIANFRQNCQILLNQECIKIN